MRKHDSCRNGAGPVYDNNYGGFRQAMESFVQRTVDNSQLMSGRRRTDAPDAIACWSCALLNLDSTADIRARRLRYKTHIARWIPARITYA
jgi:hypothetical protein